MDINMEIGTKNIALNIKQAAINRPYDKAVISYAGRDKRGKATYSHLTFKQLDQESDDYAMGFQEIGITRGTRTLVMLNPGIEYIIVMYALLKVGAIPIIVDQSMGNRRIAQCIMDSKPDAFIGSPMAQLFAYTHAPSLQSITIHISSGFRWIRKAIPLKNIPVYNSEPFQLAPIQDHENALILFSSGYNNAPKCILYQHGMLHALVNCYKETFSMGPNELDLAIMPFYMFLAPAIGSTAVIPAIHPRKLEKSDPMMFVESIWDHGVTNCYASSTILRQLGMLGHQKQIFLPSIKRFMCVGAPVDPEIIDLFQPLIPQKSQLYSIYGTVESPLICVISANEMIVDTIKKSFQGFGMCLGKPVRQSRVCTIHMDAPPIEQWTDDLMVNESEIGELIVKGPSVSCQYYEKSSEEIELKIHEGSQKWHRTGDLGWIDRNGRIWFCGRKSESVIPENSDPLFPIPCEAIFSQHERVARCALTGVGHKPYQIPVLCVELTKQDTGAYLDSLINDLFVLGKRFPHTDKIQHILIHKKLPTDSLHDTKIMRQKLSKWAERKIKYTDHRMKEIKSSKVPPVVPQTTPQTTPQPISQQVDHQPMPQAQPTLKEEMAPIAEEKAIGFKDAFMQYVDKLESLFFKQKKSKTANEQPLPSAPINEPIKPKPVQANDDNDLLDY